MDCTVVPAAPHTIVISVEYAPDGVSWARLYDNQCLAWYIDNSGLPMPPRPSIVGTLPAAAPDTTPILSPQWCEHLGPDGPAIIVPDLWRSQIGDFFTWLATNNGAARRLEARFAVSVRLHNEFAAWAGRNPDLVKLG